MPVYIVLAHMDRDRICQIKQTKSSSFAPMNNGKVRTLSHPFNSPAFEHHGYYFLVMIKNTENQNNYT